VEMVGKNAVRLYINKDYPTLHPVFNVSLTVKYYGPNTLINRGIQEEIKAKCYKDGDIVDWSKLKAILDVRMVKKDKYEYLILWTGSTVGNDTWVAQNHIPG
jgi:hypothetical protein